jgi:vacuolar-type H+-ATPase subunit D/Vma8
MGADAVDAAALAQAVRATVSWRAGSVVGVATPRLQESLGAFVASYGAAATTAVLDRAGHEFTELIPALVRLAEPRKQSAISAPP